MSKNNIFSFETVYGLKTIKLVLSDITKLPTALDILVVSAFQNSYRPYKNTVIESLHNIDISVNELADNPVLDLRNSNGVWLSKETNNKQIKRIVCSEILSFDQNINSDETDLILRKRISAIFSLLAAGEYEGINMETLAMPVIGTGKQKIDPDKVIPVMLEECKKAMETIKSLSSIYICTNNDKIFEKLSVVMDSCLGRTPIELSPITLDDYTQAIVEHMKKDLKVLVNQRLLVQVPKPTRSIMALSEFIDILENIENHRGFELTIFARRILEVMVSDLIDERRMPRSNNSSDLNSNLDKIAKQYKMAKWIKSYLHLIRILGNSSAHVGVSDEIPSSPNSNDLMILIHCLAIIIPYWKSLVLNPKH